ncbi:predicted protein [Nematostella vectensis]|uniref:Serine/threonine-protein kinase ULK3 n=1 Tax=Nematostella vectensis TaxID=45351 RepID=A7S4I8_NEMVE|nr:predicted protein [Nematostella vectensis]|eukprot:XP_001633462.1 predicted protein [Nematostella vectensis]
MAASGVKVVPPPKINNFVVAEKLGQGSYATVYKAFKKGDNRDVVAIKCIKKKTLSKAATENLLTEIELLRNLEHEHIVQLKDFQWDENHIFLIMEYCGGGDLSRFIHSKRALPERMARKFLRQLACALQYMRSYDVAHMDLKPQNLLLSSRHNPVLKIADFGFAQKLHPNSEASNIRGSPLYMAPEMICCQSYDASVDLWSVGVILYETLFGEPPFKSKTFVELEAKLRSSEPIKLPPGPRVSADCRDLLIALLQRDPKQRISFEAFFTHPFIDMEHMPSSTSLQKAVGIVSEAVSLDKDGSHKEAAQLYCQAMEYFVPAVECE